MIRSLRPDEPIPEGEPAHYKNAAGYVRLRWKVGPYEYVEGFEHRIIMGLPDGQVHHKNHDPSDNRPENLEVLTQEEHYSLHGEKRSVRHLHDDTVGLYMCGFSTVEVGNILEINPGTVSRILKEKNFPAREPSSYAAPIDPDVIRAWHAEGVRAGEMARRTGACRKRIDRMLDELGLPRFPSGNPNLGRKNG